MSAVVWKLPLSETSMLLATSRCVKPACDALRAVHRDVQLRLIGRLLNAEIGQSRHLPELAEQLDPQHDGWH